MKPLLPPLLILVIGMFVGCDQEKVANRGFALPPGDAEQGQMVFIEMRCIECHTLAGTEILIDDSNQSDLADSKKRETNVIIGGTVTRVQTYGDLVTSIINPSHRIAKGYPETAIIDQAGDSKMRVYNDVLTVTDLVDLVTFLRSEYELVSPPLTTYPYYIYPN